MEKDRTRTLVALGSISLAIGIFFLDLGTPLGVAVPVLYAIPILLTLWIRGQRFTLTLAGMASGLSLLALFLTYHRSPMWTVMPNRALGLFGIWVVTALLMAHKRASADLHQREQELEDFFENGPVGLHWAGPDGTILRANRAEMEMLGYPKEDYVGRRIGEFFFDHKKLEDIFRRLEEVETVRNYEVNLRCKDGSVKHVLVNANVFWKNEQFVRTRWFTRDITDRKRAEEERERLIVELRQAVDQIKTLRGLLPVCASCKNIRDDQGYWDHIENYIQAHSEARVSHGICPDCFQKLYPHLMKPEDVSSSSPSF
jgi:PAS domain S-box-containing protein